MRQQIIILIALIGVAMTMGCAILDGDTAGSSSSADELSIMQQPVFLEPVFVLEGIDELPDGVTLEELHVGVGAIFLEALDDDTGIAYASSTPFQLHFDVLSGSNEAEAPRLTLPHGGDFQVSVQLEPQILVGPGSIPNVVASSEQPDEASLLVNGAVYETEYTQGDDDDGTIEEPVPLPWIPDDVDEDMSGLRRTVYRIPFTYSSRRTVRFIVDEVHLVGGSSSRLVMRLQVGKWVEETIKPALYNALSDLADQALQGEFDRGENIDLTDRLDSAGGGMDGLIGGMDVEVDKQPNQEE